MKALIMCRSTLWCINAVRSLASRWSNWRYASFFKLCICTRVLTYALQEELRQERDLVSSLRSERLSFLANIDNMNSMLDVARKLSRSVVVLPCRFQRLLLFLNLMCFVVDKYSHHLVNWTVQRDRQGVLEQRWVAASRLNTLLEKRMMEQGQIWPLTYER